MLIRHAGKEQESRKGCVFGGAKSRKGDLGKCFVEAEAFGWLFTRKEPIGAGSGWG